MAMSSGMGSSVDRVWQASYFERVYLFLCVLEYKTECRYVCIYVCKI